ncbi:protein EARLY FLOWERING 4-like [Silene latifolia]|uniref:protein EARLY FLOWERING 4-like n=1 Tax=Silene latifolia TaxID=37657 RepID=UPI003D76AA42
MSSSAVESSMDDGGRRRNSGAGNRRRNGGAGDGDVGDPAAWNAFADSFSQVQTVLDRNRELIQQANENHQSGMADNMVKNVAIINELNGNISKVASIYSDLSGNFSGGGNYRRQGVGKDGGSRRNS